MKKAMYQLTLKQKPDGKIRVIGIKIDSNILREHPYIKTEIKHAMEKKLEDNHIRVMYDYDIVEEE